jgi:hypothetical protein
MVGEMGLWFMQGFLKVREGNEMGAIVATLSRQSSKG